MITTNTKSDELFNKYSSHLVVEGVAEAIRKLAPQLAAKIMENYSVEVKVVDTGVANTPVVVALDLKSVPRLTPSKSTPQGDAKDIK